MTDELCNESPPARAISVTKDKGDPLVAIF